MTKRVAERWIRSRGSLPVALVASLKAGDVVLSRIGERLTVDVATPSEIVFLLGQSRVRLCSFGAPYSWAVIAASSLVWLF